ncbi:hypothetical protein [Tsuneonella sp. SYSU-LHT278]|uniref:hypothetical protein n=1 Tax=Tsuneonella sediminis TaxID=3416089 RepID=UPI003F79041A
MAGTLAVPAAAATDGTLGATSTGTIAITASVPNRAKISGLSDVAFTNHDPASAASSAQNICVWSNTATRSYTVTATGSGAGSAFALSNAGSNVPFLVQWAGASGATSGVDLNAGSASPSFTSSAVDPNCASGGSASASLIVGIDVASLSAMSAGANYTGTLQLLISPL